MVGERLEKEGRAAAGALHVQVSPCKALGEGLGGIQGRSQGIGALRMIAKWAELGKGPWKDWGGILR